MRKGYGKYTVWRCISNIHENIANIMLTGGEGAWRWITV